MSWLRFGRLGSILARNALKSVKRLAELLAAAVERRRDRAEGLVQLRGVDLVQHRDELLEDGVDLDGDVLALDHLSLVQLLRRRVRRRPRAGRTWRRTRSTTRCRRATLDGIRCSCVRVHRQVQDGRAVRPRSRSSSPCRPATPRIFTLASGFITRPARSEITVTGTVSVKLPRNRATASAKIATIATTVPRPASGARPRLPTFIDSVPYPDRLKLPLEP